MVCFSVCVAINSAVIGKKKNPSLLKFVFYAQWSERVFPCHNSVTCLEFSSSNPSHLAVGMYDGSVAIYNVQVGDHTACIADSR